MKQTYAPPPAHMTAIYCRVSTEGQAAEDKTSLATQEAACRAKASELLLTVDERYVVREARSGEDLQFRPGIQRLLSAAKHGDFGVLLVHSMDRLSRGGPGHFHLILDALQEADVQLVFATEDFTDTPEGEIMASMRTYFARMENLRRVERTQRAKHARAAKGLPLATNHALYGYGFVDAAKTRLEPHPETAPIVQRIFREIAAGGTGRGLAARLTEEGVPTPGMYRVNRAGALQWDGVVVRLIVHRSEYWGEWRAFKTTNRKWKQRELEQHHYKTRWQQQKVPLDQQILLPEPPAPPLIDKETALSAQQQLQQNRTYSKRNLKRQQTALFYGGVARCALCGGAMSITYSNYDKLSTGLPREDYKCAKAKKGTKFCRSNSISVTTLDAAVWKAFTETIFDEAYLDQLATEMIDNFPEREDPVEHAQRIERRLAEIARQTANIAAELGRIDDPYVRAPLLDRLKQLAKEQQSLESQHVEVREAAEVRERRVAVIQSVKPLAAAIKGALPRLHPASKRAILLAFGVEVKVWPSAERTPRVEVAPHLERAYLTPVEQVLEVINTPAPETELSISKNCSTTSWWATTASSA